APRFVAVDVHPTNRPSGLTDAWPAGPEADVTPSEPTETKVIVVAHPAATPAQGFAAKTCGVVPSKLNPETRSVASELNATILRPTMPPLAANLPRWPRFL